MRYSLGMLRKWTTLSLKIMRTRNWNQFLTRHKDLYSKGVILDIATPKNRPLSAKYRRSFAFTTMKDRCPVIITRVIDNLSREKHNIAKKYGECAIDDLKAAIGELSQLKNHLQTNKPLILLENKEPDAEIWNYHFKKKEEEYGILTYYETDWLFAECYLYRKIREIFKSREVIGDMDPFFFQKNKLLHDFFPAMKAMAKSFENEGFLEPNRDIPIDKKKSELSTLFKVSLWSNRMDLSLSGGENDLNFNVFDNIQKWDCNILANDLPEVLCNVLEEKESKQIDFILDNAGTEVFSDLLLADYLVQNCGIKQINLRAKPIPWYVSDCTRKDIEDMIQLMVCDSECSEIGKRWKHFLDEGIWQIKSDWFWCTAFTFSQMPEVDPYLYTELGETDLLIVKGDLNYRKLIQDMNWEPTVKFRISLGNFHPAPLVAVRTCKADVIAGLDFNIVKRTEEKYSDWLVSGKFGLFQFDSSLKASLLKKTNTERNSIFQKCGEGEKRETGKESGECTASSGIECYLSQGNNALSMIGAGHSHHGFSEHLHSPTPLNTPQATKCETEKQISEGVSKESGQDISERKSDAFSPLLYVQQNVPKNKFEEIQGDCSVSELTPNKCSASNSVENSIVSHKKNNDTATLDWSLDKKNVKLDCTLDKKNILTLTNPNSSETSKCIMDIKRKEKKPHHKIGLDSHYKEKFKESIFLNLKSQTDFKQINDCTKPISVLPKEVPKTENITIRDYFALKGMKKPTPNLLLQLGTNLETTKKMEGSYKKKGIRRQFYPGNLEICSSSRINFKRISKMTRIASALNRRSVAKVNLHKKKRK